MINTTDNPFKSHDITYTSGEEKWTLTFIPTGVEFVMPFMLREGQEPSKIPLLIEISQIGKICDKLIELKPHESLPYELFVKAVAGCISLQLKYGE